MELKEKLSRFRDVNWLVYTLIVLFGMSSWLDTYGMWVELPILVQSLPEGWQLPSYMILVIQMANIGPLLYMVIISHCPKRKLDIFVNYAIIVIGTVSTLMLALLWNVTSEIAGSQHSTALLSFQFALAFVDCTSSVTYLPFLFTFKPQYMTSYFVGEGFSALVPSLIALIQGAGEMTCVRDPPSQNFSDSRKESTVTDSSLSSNWTFLGHSMTTIPTTAFQDMGKQSNFSFIKLFVNETPESFTFSPKYLEPKFSVQVFFIVLMLIMIISGLSFAFLNFAGFCKHEHATFPEQSVSDFQEDERTALMGKPASAGKVKSNSLSVMEEDEAKESKEKYREALEMISHDEAESEFNDKSTGDSANEKALPRAKYMLFLAITAWISFLVFGILPPIQSYSCLPYGLDPYHLAVTLSCAVQPLAFISSYFLEMKSTRMTLVATFFVTVLSAFIIWTAATSPEPPLVDHVAGPIISVMSWILITAVISYLRACIATVCRSEGKMALVWIGAWTQLGAMIGTIISFLLVSVFEVFREANPCM